MALTPRDPVDDPAAVALRRLEGRPVLVFGRLRLNLRRQVWGVQDSLRPVARAMAQVERDRWARLTRAQATLARPE